MAIRLAPADKRIVVLCALLISFASFLLLLLSSEIISADHHLFLQINAAWDHDISQALRWFSEVGSFPFLLTSVAVLWLVGERRVAFYLLVAVGIHALVGGSMKFIVDRARPFEVLEVNSIIHPTDPSFPSGHTEGAFTLAGVLGYSFPRSLPPLIMVATSVGISRVYIGVHFPLDVIAGAVFGLLISSLVNVMNLEPLFSKVSDIWGSLRQRCQREP